MTDFAFFTCRYPAEPVASSLGRNGLARTVALEAFSFDYDGSNGDALFMLSPIRTNGVAQRAYIEVPASVLTEFAMKWLALAQGVDTRDLATVFGLVTADRSLCPVCRAEAVQSGHIVPDEGGLAQEKHCGTCNAQWVEHYHLVSYEFIAP